MGKEKRFLLTIQGKGILPGRIWSSETEFFSEIAKIIRICRAAETHPDPISLVLRIDPSRVKESAAAHAETPNAATLTDEMAVSMFLTRLSELLDLKITVTGVKEIKFPDHE
jgi:hypothetical protein